MNYRHGFHAGNFADVVKHLALLLILEHLRRKETGFAVIDSHAGRGVYDLAGDAARRTGEADAGIGRLRGMVADGVLARYLALVESGGQDTYPGSPLLAARMLRPQDRLVAVEKQPDEFAILKQALTPFRKAHAEHGDGYRRLNALLPPAERRGLVLIDPPFEAADEFSQLAGAVQSALRRFAHGIYLIWYPVKAPPAVQAFCGEVMGATTAPVLRVENAVAAAEGKLARAGLLILNPPFGLDAGLEDALGPVLPRFSGGSLTLEWLRQKQ